MEPGKKTNAELILENEQLQARLAEAEEALEAIRSGEVDALFISGAAGDRVYTLEGADSAYRALVENMQEGAVTLLEDGSILYCNQRFAEIVGQSLENVLGTSFDRYIDPASEADYRALREQCRRENSSGEVKLRLNSGARVHAYLSLNTLRLNELQCVSMVVTDLSEQKRNEQIAADERLARAILDQAAECIVVCDARGIVIRVSQEARHFAPANPLSQPFEQAFPLRLNTGNENEGNGRFSCATILRGDKIANLEAGLLAGGSVTRHLLVNAGPLLGAQGEILGCVIGMTDITKRKQAENLLLAANRELAEADQRKNEFLAMLAHELRNPLAPVRNAVQILKMVGPRDPVIQKNRDMIERQVTHMARLLDDLLEVSRVTRGKIRLQKERMDLRVVVMQAVDVALHSLGGHLALVYQNPPEPLWMEGDYTRLEQVVGNLIGNAIKYTDQGEIRVSLESAPKPVGADRAWAVLRVRDTGVGIAPEMLPRIFEMFTQADQSLERTRGGLGIGLTMVQRLVQMHGGRVEASSAGPGRGSEFRVWLPLAAQAADQHEPQDQAAGGGAADNGRDPLRILVVDDNTDAAQSLSEILGIWGYPARPAYDGPTAVQQALEYRPNVILLDIGLPDMSGYEVARQLRDKPAMESVKIIALTGYGQEEARQRSKECGFDDHLIKPVNLSELQTLLKRLAG